ncbi:MAG TPA: class I SAM-dependent methyltransferase [Vicinamibacterales bacterium]|jgi:SAM-dependent methyltransferase|nr:class I SAM-dependent methyltransferase [Vicinamibacterales bacterium]
MNENPAASEWAGARGEKWRARLAGMERMLTPVDEPLIRALRLDAPSRIADIGCGGGGTTLEILRRAPAGSVVHGFDISPALIESARSRAGAAAVAFALADVATAPAPEEPYDRLVSRFGIMFYDDPPAAFANLAHWLAPAGRFAFTAWARPADNPWMTTVRDVVAEVVDVPRPDPDAPGAFRYAGADTLLALLDRAGFRDLNVTDWRGALPIGGGLPATEAAYFALASFSSFGELLAEAGDAAFNNACRALTARFDGHQQNGNVRLDACVHIVTGARR